MRAFRLGASIIRNDENLPREDFELLMEAVMKEAVEAKASILWNTLELSSEESFIEDRTISGSNSMQGYVSWNAVVTGVKAEAEDSPPSV